MLAKGQGEGTRETQQIKVEQGTKMGGDQDEFEIWINDLQENRFNKELRMAAEMRQP